MYWHKITVYIITSTYTLNTKLLIFFALHCGSRKSSQDNLENVNVFYGSALTVAFALCDYLTGCLDAKDGHTCLWVILKLVHQLNSF